MQIEKAIARYLKNSGHPYMHLKAVLFDMDGVLFDSMPYHADAWVTSMEKYGLPMTREIAFMNEGRTGMNTINMIYHQVHGKDASKELIDEIYQDKCNEFAKHPDPERMPGALELLTKLKAMGITPVLVTGSGQHTLFARFDRDYPGMFEHDKMVTAYDVKYGKPNPEPYLMGLKKAGVAPNEAIVVENAPIGIEAGRAAGVFTIAVNTGPLKDSVLLDAGANLLFSSMQALCDNWEILIQKFERHV
ncbi:MAG: HAD-IA family hydrolase [Bacteroidaceae bacterium]|nr:HAD-IA family hydrolase [Bacteroidaceae bacterium]